MSIKKIVGIETELRLDCAGLDEEKKTNERLELEDHTLPWKVVENAMACSGGASGSFISPLLWRRPKGLDDIVEKLKILHPSSEKAIEEHLEIKRGKKTQNTESEESSRRHSYQRFGFSGGYTFSGFRVYVDGTHPEVSTPECVSPRDLVCWQKAGEMIIERGRKKTEEETGYRIILSNDNSDGLGASWGSHENYLVSNELFETLTEGWHYRKYFSKTLNFFQDFWITFLATSYIFRGSGKMGSEVYGNLSHNFLISQRAEFITCAVSHGTMENRPLINQRDIPYVGREFGRRLHVVVGDSNMCEPAIFLKTGTAMIMLMMLEDNFISEDSFPILKTPIDALRIVMSDLRCQKPLDVLMNGQPKRMTAVNIQKLFCELAAKWFEERYKNEKQAISWIPEVLTMLGRVLTGLEEDPLCLFGVIDWVTKYSLCCSELGRLNTGWSDPIFIIAGRKSNLFRRLIGICGAYHRLDDLGIYNKLKNVQEIERVVPDADIEKACFEPPRNTRAYERGKFLRHFGDSVDCANWDSIHLDRNPYKIILNSPYASSLNYEAGEYNEAND